MLAETWDAYHVPPAWQSAVIQIQQPSSKLPTVWRDVVPNGYHYKAGNAITTQNKLSLDALGWTAAEALETHLRLRSFAQDWDYPGMEAYDAL